jgi:hypothetical protein
VTQPTSWASPHSEAAATAIKHLQDADAALRAAYDHPYHVDRLDNITSHLKNVGSVIEALPSQEESRADYAARLVEHHKAMKPIHDLPEEGKRLLAQELQKAGL